jgi:hypothetical protein
MWASLKACCTLLRLPASQRSCCRHNTSPRDLTNPLLPWPLQRGYLPSMTYSSHYIRDPQLRSAVGRFLDKERDDIEYTLQVGPGQRRQQWQLQQQGENMLQVGEGASTVAAGSSSCVAATCCSWGHAQRQQQQQQ